MGILLSSLKSALCTLVSARGATSGETLSRFPADSYWETGEPDHANIAVAVGRSLEDRPILVASGQQANQGGFSSRNKGDGETPCLLVLSPTSVSNKGNPATHGRF